jgi:hypothetical protein
MWGAKGKAKDTGGYKRVTVRDRLSKGKLSPDFVHFLFEVLGVMAHMPRLWRRLSTPPMGIARSEGNDLIFGSSNPAFPGNKTTPKPFFSQNRQLCVN